MKKKNPRLNNIDLQPSHQSINCPRVHVSRQQFRASQLNNPPPINNSWSRPQWSHRCKTPLRRFVLHTRQIEYARAEQNKALFRNTIVHLTFPRRFQTHARTRMSTVYIYETAESLPSKRIKAPENPFVPRGKTDREREQTQSIGKSLIIRTKLRTRRRKRKL